MGENESLSVHGLKFPRYNYQIHVSEHEEPLNVTGLLLPREVFAHYHVQRTPITTQAAEQLTPQATILHAVHQPGTSQYGGVNEYGLISYHHTASESRPETILPLSPSLIDSTHPPHEQACLLITNRRVHIVPYLHALDYYATPHQLAPLADGEMPMLLYPPNKVILSNGRTDFTEAPKIDPNYAIAMLRSSPELSKIQPYNTFVVYDTPHGQRFALIGKSTTFELIYRTALAIALDIEASQFAICQGEYAGGECRLGMNILDALITDGLELHKGRQSFLRQPGINHLEYPLSDDLGPFVFLKRRDVLLFVASVT